MGKETQKVDTRTTSVSNTILSPENEERMEGLRPENVNMEEMIEAKLSSINNVLVPDPKGPIVMKIPTMRDPETHQQIYMERHFREHIVPNDEVLFHTGSVIMDWNATHQATVEVGGKRQGYVFDRTYVHKKRLYNQCAWVPDDKIGDKNIPLARAGLLYCKMIDKRTHRPIAVLRRQPDGKTPMYQIIGGKEMESHYRELKKVFENFFIKRGGPIDSRDEGLSNFMYETISPIPEEVTG